jgi:hypothetical protein
MFFYIENIKCFSTFKILKCAKLLIAVLKLYLADVKVIL